MIGKQWSSGDHVSPLREAPTPPCIVLRDGVILRQVEGNGAEGAIHTPPAGTSGRAHSVAHSCQPAIRPERSTAIPESYREVPSTAITKSFARGVGRLRGS